ncbi:MAG: FCD domain-containing protein [Streptosporangiales bacterium]|nr:FCD domain-containing protein [Streptosporangiales bacterium]
MGAAADEPLPLVRASRRDRGRHGLRGRDVLANKGRERGGPYRGGGARDQRGTAGDHAVPRRRAPRRGYQVLERGHALSRRRSSASTHGLRPVSATRVVDAAIDRIRRFIIDNDLGAGARLPSEREFAEVLGASRPTVSQALRTLSLMGLIEIRPGSGAFVARKPATMVTASVNLMLDLEPSSADQLAQLRYWLEAAGANEAARVWAGEDLAEVEKSLRDIRASEGSTSSWMVADTAFHIAIAKASRNRYLADLFEGVHTTVLKYVYEGWVERDEVPEWLAAPSWDEIVAVHTSIFTALAERDDAALSVHLSHHHRLLLDHIAYGQAGTEKA